MKVLFFVWKDSKICADPDEQYVVEYKRKYKAGGALNIAHENPWDYKAQNIYRSLKTSKGSLCECSQLP